MIEAHREVARRLGLHGVVVERRPGDSQPGGAGRLLPVHRIRSLPAVPIGLRTEGEPW